MLGLDIGRVWACYVAIMVHVMALYYFLSSEFILLETCDGDPSSGKGMIFAFKLREGPLKTSVLQRLPVTHLQISNNCVRQLNNTLRIGIPY